MPLALDGAEHRELGTLQGLRRQQDVVQYGQIGEQVGDLEGPGHAEMGPPVGRQPRDVLSVEVHLSVRRVEFACDHVEKRRLTRSVRTDDAPAFAVFHHEVDVTDRDEAAEVLGESLHLQTRGGPVRTLKGFLLQDQPP